MGTMKALLALGLVLSVAAHAWREGDVQRLCAGEAQSAKCVGACLDGWSNTTFTRPNGGAFARREVAVCQPCKNTYQMKEGKDWRALPCEDFYRGVRRADADCKKCVNLEIQSGG